MLTAVSGMNASAARLSASASNVANAESTGALPTSGAQGAPMPYQPVDVVQTSVGAGSTDLGTAVTYRPREPAYIQQYDPDAAFTDGRGMVAAPNVDLAEEAVSQVEAALSFRANLAVFKTADEMAKNLLDTLA